MSNKIDFVEVVKKSFGAVPLRSIAIDPQLRHIQSESGAVDLEIYQMDKFEKIVLSTIKIYQKSIVEASAIAWPDAKHHLPVLWCNLTIVSPLMNFIIFDFIPMLDPVSWPGYAESCLDVNRELKTNALERLGDTVIDNNVMLRSKTMYALSPYSLIANIKETGLSHVPDITNAYINAYLKLWEKARSIEKSNEFESYTKKRAATRTLMKNNDPGYPKMVGAFGEEMTHKVFEAIF